MAWRDVYGSARGRLDRERYWLASLPLVGAQIAVALWIGSAGEPGLSLLGAVLYLALAGPTFVITVKRLHDRDRSGWFLAVALIPLVGPIWLAIEAGLLPGTRGPNRFGPDPLAGTGARGAPSLSAPI